MGKSQIKRIVLTHLLDEEIIPPSKVTDKITRDKSGMTGKELLQLKRLEIEERDKEREAQYQMKELELREKELTFQVKLKELEAKVDRSIRGAIEAGAMVPFDVSKHIQIFVKTRLINISFILRKLPKALNGLKITGHYCCRAP